MYIHTKMERAVFGAVALGALAFVYLPVLSMYAHSVVSENGFDLSAYRQVAYDARAWGLLFRSVAIGAGAALACCALGVPTALLLARGTVPGRRVLGALLFGPLAVPPQVHASAWIALAGNEGVLSRVARQVLHVQGLPVSAYGVPGTVLVLTVAYYPIVTLFTLASLAQVDGRLEEAALFSLPARKVLTRVTLRLALPGVLSGAAVVYAFAFSNFGVPMALRVNTYPLEVFSRFAAAYDLRRAVAQSLPLLVVAVAPLLAAMSWAGRRRRLGTFASAGPHVGRWRPLAPAGCFAVPFLVMLLAVTFVVPLVVLVCQLADPGQLMRVVGDSWPQAARSLLLSLGVGAAGALVGFVIGYGLARRTLPMPEVTEVLAFLPVAIPPTVVGLGLISAWDKPGLRGSVYGTPLILAGAFAVGLAPLLVRVVMDAVSQTQGDLEEAAALHGASRRAELLHVVLPQLRPALAAGAAICVVLAMGELGATVLLHPPGFDTLSLRVFMLMHYGTRGEIGAGSLFLVALSVSAGALIAAGARRRGG